ncbi:hypothetical protein SLA2020_104110 [Shorea laevis]
MDHSIAAELWATRDGLEVAISKGFFKIIVEIDSKLAIILIGFAGISLHSLGVLISDCISLLEHFSNVRISHIYGEAHVAVDFMAKLGIPMVMDFVLYEESFLKISFILFHDCIGIVFPITIVAT